MLKSHLILHCANWIMDESCWEWQTVLSYANYGAGIAWELTKRGSKDCAGVQSHPRHNDKFANYNGHVFIKSDSLDEDKDAETVRQPDSSDDESFRDACLSESHSTEDGGRYRSQV
jgi:hypothetical protein